MLSLSRMIASCLLAGVLVVSTQPSSIARVLQNIDDETVGLLANYLASDTPNFRERALKTKEYREANEFDKPEVLERIEARMRSEYEGFADIDGIKLRVRTKIGEFDAAKGVYRIRTFRPGVFFRFGRYSLTLDNASDFYEWELPVAEARRIREMSQFGNMIAEILLRPFGVAPDDQNQVRTQVIDLKLFEERSGQLVHSKLVPEAEYRDIQVASSTGPTMLPEETISLLDIRPGMAVEEAKGILKDAGYRVDGVFGGYRGVHYNFSTAPKRQIDYSSLDRNNRASGIFGLGLDCRDSDQIHSCGHVRFDTDTNQVISVILLQNAVGTSKQDLVSALFEKYGPATDRFATTLWEEHLVDQYVWGGFIEGNRLPASDLTPISGPKHWQVEAIIAEPDTRRKTVIVQINKVDGPTAVTGTGGVRF